MARRFPISFSSWMRVISTPIGLGPRRSWVDVDERTVRVQMGWAFTATLDRSAIASAAPYEGRVRAGGAHGWRGRWLVNGASHGIVTVRLEPSQRGRVLAFPLRIRELAVSVDDATALLAALPSGAAGTSGG